MHKRNAPWAKYVDEIPQNRPILIAGATASGKSDLALYIAKTAGGVIVNADALQIYSNWQVLTARPGPDETAQAPHLMYGHVYPDQPYSVGDWMREIQPILAGTQRPIIVGGTGLYFRALTEGLAEIPPTSTEIRKQAQSMFDQGAVTDMIAELDPETRDRIDLDNPARVMRAWEVLQTTGRSMAWWHDATPPPVLPIEQAAALHLDSDKDWLNERIARRFDLMMDQGALTEAEANLPGWNPSLQSSQAIGAPELIAHLRGELSRDDAIERANIATRQYAKRQRTWFRKRMKSWNKIVLPLKT